MGQAHFAVVGGLHDDRLLRQAQLVQEVERRVQVRVRLHHQVGVKLQVLARLRDVLWGRAGGEVQDTPLGLGDGLCREALNPRRRQLHADVFQQLRRIARRLKVRGEEQDVVGVDQGDDEEHGLDCFGQVLPDVLEGALLAW